MKTQKEMFSKKNSGFTLVELLVTIAILGFVILAIGGALVSSAKSYRSGNVEVDLQQQSQITANLISSLVQDASDVSFVGKKLEIKQKTDAGEIVYAIEQKDSNLVYTVTGTAIVDDNTEELLAEHLTADGFSVDDSTFDTTKNVTITLEFEEDGKTFKTTYNMTARNGNGTGSTALLAVRDICIEPGETFPLTKVSNRPLSWGPLSSSCGSTITVLPNGDAELKISKTETAGILTVNVTTVPPDASETPKSQTVNIYVRRVASVDLVATYDGGMYNKDTTYRIVPDFTQSSANTNLKTIPNADYKGAYNYREYEEVEWSVVEGASLIDGWQPVNFTSNENATICSANFTLNKTLVPGDKIVIEAKAVRPSHVSRADGWAMGYGTASNPDTGEVIGRYTIAKKDDIRRGAPYDFPKTQGQDEPQMNGFQKKFYFRFSNPNMTNKDDPATWAGRSWITENGEDTAGTWNGSEYIATGKYRIQGTILNKMDPTKSYLIQMAFVYVPGDNQTDAKANEIINSYTPELVNKYITTFQVDAATISLRYVKKPDGSKDDTVNTQDALGTESNPYSISKSGRTDVVFEALAHSPSYFQNCMQIVKVSYRNDSSAGWNDLTGEDFKTIKNAITVKDDGELNFEGSNKCAQIWFNNFQNSLIAGKVGVGTELRIVFDWNSSKSEVAQEGTPETFYDTTEGDGIFYIKIAN